MTHPLAPLARELAAQAVRYVVIGVSGANLYAPSGQTLFESEDIDPLRYEGDRFLVVQDGAKRRHLRGGAA